MQHFKYFLILVALFIMPGVVKANKIGEFKQTIDVDVNCDQCNPWEEQEITVQLFGDGVAVEGKSAVLNKTVGYTTRFEDLELFREDSNEKINYEVKVYKEGKLVTVPKYKTSYKKENISKWVSVLPEDLQAGHDYIFLTDNWNYENNGFSKHVVLRGDVTVKGGKPDADNKRINGKSSYYSLIADPPANAVWHLKKNTSDTWLLTNEEGKNLTVSGYNKGDFIHYIFKHSGKVGYIEADDAFNNNELTFDPIEDTLGRFYIVGTGRYQPPVTEGYGSFVDNTEDTLQYLGLDFNNQVEAQVEREYGAQFLAFEYYEGEAEIISNVEINMDLCDPAPEVNPDTLDNITKYIALFCVSIALIVGAIVIPRIKSKKE